MLTKVLCEQLLYGVIVNASYKDGDGWKNNDRKLLGVYQHDGQVYLDGIYTSIDNVKPYIRPLSSMTEEEEAKLSNILPCGMSFSYTTKEELIIYTDCEGDNDHYFICFVEVQDFLNAHHFDYRGLIPKGLAIAAVGDDNPYKEKGGEE